MDFQKDVAKSDQILDLTRNGIVTALVRLRKAEYALKNGHTDTVGIELWAARHRLEGIMKCLERIIEMSNGAQNKEASGHEEKDK